MDIRFEINHLALATNLELLAKQVVEGFIAGMHKSPFHGFSAEFAEHKIYNRGESIRHIDWKLFAKTEKLYTKRYDDETNLRCHIIVDNSSSMYYPKIGTLRFDNLNKIGFAALAAAALSKILKKQRDAVGLSIYNDSLNFYAPERSSERHHSVMIYKLAEILDTKPQKKTTNTYRFLHQIAERVHKRSLIVLFSDMLQNGIVATRLFEALRHLKYNKHDVILFHVMDKATEIEFNFDNTPKRFTDLETNEQIDLFTDQVQEKYRKAVTNYFDELKLYCLKYKIKYIEADISKGVEPVLTSFLIERQKFLK